MDIESIDDIYDYYYTGQLDQAQFEYLLQSYDMGGLSYSDLLAIGIGDPVELFGYQDLLPDFGLSKMFENANINRAGLREYFRSAGRSSGNYYVAFGSSGYNYSLKIRSAQKRYFCDSRSLRYTRTNLSLTAGNYLADEGCGLVIGRYDYRPSTGYDNPYDFDFWSPVNSYYNGLKIQLSRNQINGRIYSSAKNYADFHRRFLGGGLLWQNDNILIGAACGFNDLYSSDIEDSRLAEGLNFRYSYSDYELGGEIAQVNRSGGIYLTGAKHLESAIIKTDYWHYAPRFENYNCSGKAASDYRSFYPAGQEIGFRTTQAGETGIATNYDRRNFGIGWQFWKQADDPKLNIMVATRCAIRLQDYAIIRNQMSYSIKNENGAVWLKSAIGEISMPYLEWLGIKLASENKKLIHSECYGFIELKHAQSEHLEFDANLRACFDGSWRGIFTEKALLSGGFRFDIELVIGSDIRTSLIFEKTL